MAPLIECVPNFSEGEDAATLGALEEALRSVPRAHLLDRHADRWHNRSVFTIAGAPERVLEAAFRATEVASHCIDLRKHQGVHPRMGATDVVPFVSLGPARHRCHTACRRFWSGRA